MEANRSPPWGETWTATSTGACRGGDGGSSESLSMHRRPWHCLRLCSMNSSMSAKGNLEWHWPQVRRSWSPLGVDGSDPRWLSSSSGISVAVRGSARGGKQKSVRCDRVTKLHDNDLTSDNYIYTISDNYIHFHLNESGAKICNTGGVKRLTGLWMH